MQIETKMIFTPVSKGKKRILVTMSRPVSVREAGQRAYKLARPSC